MEKIIWTDHVRNEEVLLRVNEQRNILHEISKWKAYWIGHILRINCLLQRVIDGKIHTDASSFILQCRNKKTPNLLEKMHRESGNYVEK